MLFCTVPDKMVHNRRNFLFHKSILSPPQDKTGQQDEESPVISEEKPTIIPKEDPAVTIQGEVYDISSLPMDKLLKLNIDDLRDLDLRIKQFDSKP